MSFVCLASIVSSYVFGATWEDISKNKSNETNYPDIN